MSAPLVPLTLLWLVGLLLGGALSLSWETWLLLAGLLPWGGYHIVRGGPAPAPSPLPGSRGYLALALLALLLGGARGAATFPARPDLTVYNDRGPVTLEGTVIAYPEPRGSYTRYRLAASAIRAKEADPARPTRGELLVILPAYPPFQYGDRLEIRGELVTPPRFERFDYRAFLASKGIYSLLRRGKARLLARGEGAPLLQPLYGLRTRGARTIGQILPEPHAALMQGILLGLGSTIPDEVMERFNATGTTHVLVISGSNFAILSAIFLFLGRRLLGVRGGSFLAAGAIVLYALLVGAEPPVVRAALMGLISILALLLRRGTVALNSLALAVLLMSAAHPGQLHDAGFQLSALATLGLILFVPPLTAWSERWLAHQRWYALSPSRRARLLALLGDALLVTLAAQISTLPLIVGTFGRLSLVSLLTNLLILPVQSWILLGGGLATLAGMIWLPLGRGLALIPHAGLAWTLALVEVTARVPLASVEIGPFPSWTVWSFYSLAGLGWWARNRSLLARIRERLPPLPAGKGPFLLALLLALLPWWLLAQRPDGRLHLYMLDVGQGDALLIVTPDGKQLLVDGGPDPLPLLAQLGARMPVWDRTIELVVLSHPDADHLGGLPELLGRYRVAGLLDSGQAHETPLYEGWVQQLRLQGIEPQVAVAGQQLPLGQGAWLEVLAPLGAAHESLNDNSVVLRLRYGDFCALLTGDIGASAEARLLASGSLEPCQLLKVPHHGSRSSSSQPFLERVRPALALISAGRENRFGHPHEEVVARLEAIGARILRTDQAGVIHIATDGQRLWIEREN